MEISQIKQLKTDLRVKIAEMISEFELKTEVKVLSLEVHRDKMIYPYPDLIQVVVKVDIG